MNEYEAAGNEVATYDQGPPVGQELAVAEGENRSERQIAFYWSKLAFLLFVSPILAAMVFFSLPFIHVFDEPGSGTALGIIMGFYVMFAGPAWLAGTAVGLVSDIRALRRLRRSGTPLAGSTNNWHHVFNVFFWLVFLPVAGFSAWFILSGYFR